MSATDLIAPVQEETKRHGGRAGCPCTRHTAPALCNEGVSTNAQCSAAVIEKVAAPDAGGLALMREASEKLGFSARAYHRVLKVARTLADLDGAKRSAAFILRGDLLPDRRRKDWCRLHDAMGSGKPGRVGDR